jgi:hypothetical protein
VNLSAGIQVSVGGAEIALVVYRQSARTIITMLFFGQYPKNKNQQRNKAL